MGTYIRATAFIAIAVSASAAWGQATPDLYDSTGKAVGQYKGDSVIILRKGTDPVRIYTDAHWDYSSGGKPLSSGLTLKYVPIYYATPDCTGQPYISTSPTEPQAPGGPTPGTGPAYTSPAYGSQYLVATWKSGTNWYIFYSDKTPQYQQVNIFSQRQYDGTCYQRSYSNMWVTQAKDWEWLGTYGTPPFYVK